MSKFFSLAYLTLPNTHPVDQIEDRRPVRL